MNSVKKIRFYLIRKMSLLINNMFYTSEEESYRKYGIVILEVYDETLRTTIYHYRKPTPSERKEIILNFIIDNSGTPIKVNYLSSSLAVSDRTIKR